MVSGTPKPSDKAGITLYRKNGGIWYSNNWDGTKTIMKALNGQVTVGASGITTAAARVAKDTTISSVTATNRKYFNPLDKLGAAIKGQLSVEKLSVKVMPNPSPNYFTLVLHSGSNEKATIRVVDITGRAIDQKLNVNANSTEQIGSSYRPGVYIAEIRQGNDVVTVKLIKL